MERYDATLFAVVEMHNKSYSILIDADLNILLMEGVVESSRVRAERAAREEAERKGAGAAIQGRAGVPPAGMAGTPTPVG
jgi:hypothetical protein